MDAGWQAGNQAFSLEALLTRQRFHFNQDLDNTSGKATLDWSWRLGHRWIGRLGADYARSLASFAATRSLQKDLFDTGGYAAEVEYALTPRWRLEASAHRSSTTHGNPARRYDDLDLDAGVVGARYLFSSAGSLGWEYRESRARFPRFGSLADQGSRDYREHGAQFNLRYAITVKTSFQGAAGYVKRDYRTATIGSFSGDTWNAALVWAASSKLQFTLRAARELKAYLYAESDHFVATGNGLELLWQPTGKLGVSMQWSHESERYIGLATTLSLVPMRRDTVDAGNVQITYVPRTPLTFALAYRLETRDSNRPAFAYDAAAASLRCNFQF